MFEIEGVYATAKCYATNIEESAINQVRAMCDQPFTKGANVAIMPDAYKAAKDIMGPIAEAVDVVDVMKPIYNFKAQN